MHRLGLRLFTCLLAVAVGAGLAAPAYAQGKTKITLAGTSVYAGQSSTLRVQLTDANGNPMANEPITVEHKVGDAWVLVDGDTTNAEGRASVSAVLSKKSGENVYRARYDGPSGNPSTSGAVTVELKRRNSTVTVSGPGRVKDEKSVEIRVLWETGSGDGVPGRVKLFRRNGKGGEWNLARKLSTGADGRVTITVTPREDTWWRAQGVQQDWVQGDRSKVHAIDNIPPGNPVKLPKGAPKPRINLPDQPDAVGNGANPVITRIPNRVWNQMTGITWRRGCPVGRAGLRYLKVNYWDYGGYRRRGELVANADSVGQMADALAEMYRKKLPIRAMYRVDRFGYSQRVRGGDDYKSMAAGNTSAFNCRQVVGNPGARSPHSYGRSLDVNTWENPYRSAQGTVPNTWWMSHSHKRVAWRSRSHAVVRLMASHGLRWTYGNRDTQHFDARAGGARTSARLNANFLECGGVCD